MIGSVIDRFEILSLAGKGGMGRVYRAFDTENQCAVALKVAPTDEGLARLLEEASTLSSFTHPALVRYVHHGETPAGAFLAMEWVEGETLSRRLARGRLAASDAVALGARIGRALGAAHSRSVLHRDLKPGNVMLRGNDLAQPVVVDFGIAQRPGRVEITHSGILIGTPSYMAPEQARADKTIDARVDVFALGCLVFRCLTGRRPFNADRIHAVLAKILLEPTPRVRDFCPDVSPELDDAVARLMDKERQRRPGNGTEAAELLEGVSLAAEDCAPRATALTSSERRVVSVIVAGVAGEDPTVITGRDEDRPVFDEIPSVLLGQDAHVEPLASGALVAMLTGSAIDQALRAGRAALEIRKRFPAVSVALATGHEDVTAGVPIGETIERATTFLESSAAGGDIRVDEVTAALLDARFEVRVAGDAYFLRSERTALTTRKLLGKATPFVGRDREMAMLMGALRESFEERVALVMLVTGAPGTGKSRLRHELMGRIHHELGSVQVWTATGDPLRAASPLDIAGQIVCAAAGAEASDSPGRRDALRALAARHFTRENLARVTEFLAEVTRAPAAGDPSPELRAARRDHELMRDQMKRAWVDLVAAETAVGPRLIVVDDLHWGDLTSVQLIDHALHSLPESPLCVLALARPDVHEAFPRLWSDCRLTEVKLAELTRRATESLAKDVLGDTVSPEIMARVVELSGGNAFHLEELIRGVAQGRTSELPNSVLAMSESRLDGLDPDMRRLLRAASLFGTTFWDDAVAALLGDDAGFAQTWLRAAESMELLHRRPQSRFATSVEYGFRHALLREAAYAALTADDRRLGHELAAGWLEKAGERDARVMAEHWERAGETERAIPHLVAVAEQALKATEAREVMRAAEKAIAMGASGEELGRVQLAAAEAGMWSGSGGVEYAAAAMDLLPEGSAPWYRAAATLGVLASRSGRHDYHAELRSRLVRVLSAGPMTGDAIAAGAQAAFAVTVAFRDAEDLFPLLLPHRHALDHEPFARASLEHALFMRAVLNGRTRSRDIHALRDAIAPLDALGGARVAHMYRANLAYAERMLGLLDEAARDFELLKRSVALSRAKMFAAHNAAIIARMRGDLNAALRGQEEALALVGMDVRLEVATRVELVRIHLARGDDGRARQVLEAFDASDLPPQHAAIVLAARACIELTTDASSACALAAQAAGLAGEGIEGEAFVHLTHVRCLGAAGRSAEARAALDTVTAKLRAHAAELGDDGATWLALPDHVALIDLAAADARGLAG